MAYALNGPGSIGVQGFPAKPGGNVPVLPMSTGQGYQPVAIQGTIIDSSGSSGHLPPSYFNQGSSAQLIPTGGAGLGNLGVPTSSGCSICDWAMNNILLIALVAVAILVIVFVVR